MVLRKEDGSFEPEISCLQCDQIWRNFATLAQR